jgi:hypothetical protein
VAPDVDVLEGGREVEVDVEVVGLVSEGGDRLVRLNEVGPFC